ncbi:MAG: hypothetical protein NPMRTH1_820054 [Nitrosopumilales archaeon]|nr:MAG: hypothetical protein NPMRTH1_820054 [Nitrosopumilales archaeon]
MVKVVRVGGRGTKRRIVEKESDNWTGESYRGLQKKRKEAAKGRTISTGRGTRSVKYGDIKETTGRPSGKGRYISTARGTKRRKVK